MHTRTHTNTIKNYKFSLTYSRQIFMEVQNKWYTPLLVAWDSAYWGEKHLKISTPIIQIYVDGSVRSQSRVPHCMGE